VWPRSFSRGFSLIIQNDFIERCESDWPIHYCIAGPRLCHFKRLSITSRDSTSCRYKTKNPFHHFSSFFILLATSAISIPKASDLRSLRLHHQPFHSHSQQARSIRRLSHDRQHHHRHCHHNNRHNEFASKQG
jgi:hypothetical protein